MKTEEHHLMEQRVRRGTVDWDADPNREWHSAAEDNPEQLPGGHGEHRRSGGEQRMAGQAGQRRKINQRNR
jgi:hypothetical protein